MKRKLAEWAKRYLPAEVISTLITLAAAWLVRKDSAVTIALVSAWCGNVSYYAVILIADFYHARRKGEKPVVVLRGLLVEFGPAEILDSLLIRPAAMYLVPRWVPGFALGIFIAKLTADILFYIPTILGYELNKKYLKP